MTVDAVLACSRGELAPCTWMVRVGYDEDGGEIIRDCGADAYPMRDGRGWECAHGHSHVFAEVRFAEGWDYASDAEEAQNMRRNGIDAVGPDGASI